MSIKKPHLDKSQMGFYILLMENFIDINFIGGIPLKKKKQKHRPDFLNSYQRINVQYQKHRRVASLTKVYMKMES